MAKSKWNSNRRQNDTVAISDGTITYYAEFDLELYTLDEVAQKFAESYDHNGIDGDVRCEATRLDNGATVKFTC